MSGFVNNSPAHLATVSSSGYNHQADVENNRLRLRLKELSDQNKALFDERTELRSSLLFFTRHCGVLERRVVELESVIQMQASKEKSYMEEVLEGPKPTSSPFVLERKALKKRARGVEEGVKRLKNDPTASLKTAPEISATVIKIKLPQPEVKLSIFGVEQWAELGVVVEDAPSVPSMANLDAKNTFLVMIPKDVSLEDIQTIFSKYTKFSYRWNNAWTELKNRKTEQTQWVSFSRSLVDGSRGKSLAEQKVMAERLGSRLPKVIEAVIACFALSTFKNERLLNDNPFIYTSCADEIKTSPKNVTVGGYSKTGLQISYSQQPSASVGILMVKDHN